MGKQIAPITEGLAHRLLAYNWPGNIRELQNVIERAAITACNGQLNLDRALPETAGTGTETKLPELENKPSRVLTIKEIQAMERENIILALNASDWKVAGATGAAAMLQIKSTTLSSRIKALGIKRP